MSIVDEETNAKAAEFLGSIKDRLKRIDVLRKEFTAPLNEQVKKINNMFKPEIEKLQHLEVSIKRSMAAYMDEQERIAREKAEEERKKREAEIRKAQEEAEKLRIQAEKEQDDKRKAYLELKAQETEKAPENKVILTEKPTTTIRTETATVSKKKVWTFEVTDEALLLKNFPQFFSVDEKKINAFVQETKQELDENGLKIFQKTIISAR